MVVGDGGGGDGGGGDGGGSGVSSAVVMQCPASPPLGVVFLRFRDFSVK